MSEKSYVTMEQAICVVCAKPYDTGALLIDKRLRERFERHTLTGWGMCPEHEEMRGNDFVAIVGCDESQSSINSSGTLNPQDAYRTGAVAHVKAAVWENIMDVPVPEQMVCFCDEEVIEMLQAMQSVAEDES